MYIYNVTYYNWISLKDLHPSRRSAHCALEPLKVFDGQKLAFRTSGVSHYVHVWGKMAPMPSVHTYIYIHRYINIHIHIYTHIQILLHIYIYTSCSDFECPGAVVDSMQATVQGMCFKPECAICISNCHTEPWTRHTQGQIVAEPEAPALLFGCMGKHPKP